MIKGALSSSPTIAAAGRPAAEVADAAAAATAFPCDDAEVLSNAAAAAEGDAAAAVDQVVVIKPVSAVFTSESRIG